MRIRYWRFLWMASFWICQRRSFTWLLRLAYLPSIWCRQECWQSCLQAVLRLWTRVEVGSWNQRSESETFKVNFLLPESFECSKKSRCWLKRSSDPWRYFNCSYISKLSSRWTQIACFLTFYIMPAIYFGSFWNCTTIRNLLHIYDTAGRIWLKGN